MTNLETATKNYIEAILASEEYCAYRVELEKVKQFPTLKTQIDEYRRTNFSIQCSQDNTFHNLDEFVEEFQSFRENPLVEDFLSAELNFCRLIQKLNLQVMAELHFE